RDDRGADGEREEQERAAAHRDSLPWGRAGPGYPDPREITNRLTAVGIRCRKSLSDSFHIITTQPRWTMKNIQLLVIDPQNDFCRPDGALAVPGADADMDRLARLVGALRDRLADIHVTLDSHRK